MDGKDLLQIPNQLGTAVLKISTGAPVKTTGQLEGQQEENTLKMLYGMLQDVGPIVEDESLRRITVSYSQSQYVMAISSGFAYIVKKSPDE